MGRGGRLGLEHRELDDVESLSLDDLTAVMLSPAELSDVTVIVNPADLEDDDSDWAAELL